MAKTLRQLAAAGFTTKGAELTFPELDQNFIDLHQANESNASAITILQNAVPDLGLFGVRAANKTLTTSGTITNFNGLLLIDYGDLCAASPLGLTRIKFLRPSRVRIGLRYNVQTTGLGANQNARLHSYLKKFTDNTDLVGAIMTESYHSASYYDDDPASKTVAYSFNLAASMNANEEIAIYTYRDGDGAMTLNSANQSIPDPDLGATSIPIAGTAIFIQTII